MASIAKAARKLSGRLAPERSHNVVLRIVTPPQPFPKYKGTMATRGTVSFVGSRVKNCRSLPEWDILTPAVEYHLQVVEYQSQAVESQLGPLLRTPGHARSGSHPPSPRISTPSSEKVYRIFRGAIDALPAKGRCMSVAAASRGGVIAGMPTGKGPVG